MSSKHEGTSTESEFVDVEVKLVYNDREVPTLITTDFLKSSVGHVKQQIMQDPLLAPITEPVEQLALYVKLPVFGEDTLEELIDEYKMSDYAEKLSSCLELRLQKREV